MKKIFILDSSFREGSNSSYLALSFAKGAKEAGHDVKYIKLKDLNLYFCKGCLACSNLKKCVIKDDMNSLYDVVSSSDILVFAAPVYYYDIPGQLKTFLDRLNPLYFRNNNFKEVYLLSASAEDDEKAIEGSKQTLSNWISCFDGVSLVGAYLAKGMDKPNQIVTMPNLLEGAYRLGNNIK